MRIAEKYIARIHIVRKQSASKFILPMVLGLGLVGMSGCDSASEAQFVHVAEKTANAEQISSVADLFDKTREEAARKKAQNSEESQEAAQNSEQSEDIVVNHWAVDMANSHLKFSALQEGEPFDGAFESFSADIQFHPNNLAGSSVKVTVPISAINAGNTDRNSTVPGKVWFSVKKFPNAVYTASSFKSTGDNSYEAVGELMMKGVSVPLTLPFTLEIDGDKAVMRAKLEINRNDWNIGEKPWNTDEWVSTSVGLDIQITAAQSTAE